MKLAECVFDKEKSWFQSTLKVEVVLSWMNIANLMGQANPALVNMLGVCECLAMIVPVYLLFSLALADHSKSEPKT